MSSSATASEAASKGASRSTVKLNGKPMQWPPVRPVEAIAVVVSSPVMGTVVAPASPVKNKPQGVVAQPVVKPKPKPKSAAPPIAKPPSAIKPKAVPASELGVKVGGTVSMYAPAAAGGAAVWANAAHALRPDMPSYAAILGPRPPAGGAAPAVAPTKVVAATPPLPLPPVLPTTEAWRQQQLVAAVRADAAALPHYVASTAQQKEMEKRLEEQQQAHYYQVAEQGTLPLLWRARRCDRGDACRYFRRNDCHFAHDDAELRCKFFAWDGRCRFGVSCKHGKHTLVNLDAREAPTAVQNRNTKTMLSGEPPVLEGAAEERETLSLDYYDIPKGRGGLWVAQTREMAQTRRSEAELSGRKFLSGLGMRPGVVDADVDRRREHLHALLWVEEAQQATDMQRYAMPHAPPFEPQHHCGSVLFKIPCPGLAERRPSILRGDQIHVRDNGTGQWYRGYAHFVNLDHVCVSFHDSFYPRPDRSYDVEFVLKRRGFRLQHRSIDDAAMLLTPQDAIRRFATAPIEAGDVTAGVWAIGPEKPLNALQEAFVARAAHGTDRVLLLHGPPGTGKTTTLVVLLQRLLRSRCVRTGLRPRILVVTPSNLSADLIVERLSTALQLPEHSRHHRNHVVRPMSVSRDPKEITPQVAKCVVRSDMLTCADVEGAPITVCTLIMAAMVWGLGLGQGFYDVVVIDEAAQATEPELCCALQWVDPNHTRVVLAGDHKQLGPVIMSPAARAFGLATSPLARLASDPMAQGAVTMLCETYRAYPSIVQMYQRPYNHRLEVRRALNAQSMDSWAAPFVFNTFTNDSAQNLNRSHVMLCHVEGQEGREADSPSWMNLEEAQVVLEYVARLLSFPGVVPSDIVILCPYMKQCEKMRGLLHDRFKAGLPPFLQPYGWDGRAALVKVATVEVFQGREARFVLLSCVRSQHVHEIDGVDRRFNIGFTRNPERANVALSRARDGLIVVGNFRTLATCDVWKGVVEDGLDQDVVWNYAARQRMTAADFASSFDVARCQAVAERARVRAEAAQGAEEVDPGYDEGLPPRQE